MALVLIPGALSACGTPAPDEPMVSAEPPVTATPATAPRAAPDTPPDTPPNTPDVAALPPAPRPAILNGLTDNQVTRLIGVPRFQRAEDPTALWRYGAEGCVLDLYMRADGPVYRVVHFEFRPDPRQATAGAAPAFVDAAACFARMTRAHSEARG